jgi:PIN domain nuclease of toxin-antitoxin system
MILLDTHIVAWLADQPSRLSRSALLAIDAARSSGGIAISDKTLWELAMMIHRRRLEFDPPLRDFLVSVERHCTVLPINSAIAERSMQFTSNFSSDRSDQIIAATAIVHNMSLVTADKVIRRSGEVACVW